MIFVKFHYKLIILVKFCYNLIKDNNFHFSLICYPTFKPCGMCWKNKNRYVSS